MKTDLELGKKVRDYLIEKKVETPMIESHVNVLEKEQIIENSFSTIMESLGLDLSDDSLVDTPKRVAKMYVREIFQGLDYNNFPKCTAVENKMQYDEMLVERNVNVQSNCEHHFVIIDGVANVGYIPKDKVIGLSKINRIVEFFSKRPQIQERLTEQIFHALCFILETDNVAVMIDAQHFCVKSRGIKDMNSRTTTSRLGGKFKEDINVRNEFLSISLKQQ